MNKKIILISIIAIIGSLGVGYNLPRLNNTPQEKSLEPHKDNEHEEELHDSHSSGKEGQVIISSDDAKSAGIEISKVSFGTGEEIRILGRIMASPDAKATVSTPLSGKIIRVFVSPGSEVKIGSPLLEILSPESASLLADSSVANSLAKSSNAKVDTANNSYNSDLWLYDKGVISRRELENSRTNAISANAEYKAAIAMTNASKTIISAVGNPSSNGKVIIRSPINGVVSLMPTSIGSFVQQGNIYVEIINIANTEAVFQVAPAILEKISIGSTLKLSTIAEQQVTAIIKSIIPGSDVGTTSSLISAKIIDKNLPIGTVVNGHIISQTGSQDFKVIVPTEAIANFADGQKVFVNTNNGFLATSVIIGNSFNGKTEIVKGLKGDEIIAIKNVFLLKSELLKKEVEHEH